MQVSTKIRLFPGNVACMERGDIVVQLTAVYRQLIAHASRFHVAGDFCARSRFLFVSLSLSRKRDCLQSRVRRTYKLAWKSSATWKRDMHVERKQKSAEAWNQDASVVTPNMCQVSM